MADKTAGSIVSQGNFLRIDNAIVDQVSFSSRNTGFIIISYSAPGRGGFTAMEQLRLNVNNNTIVLNSFRIPICFCDIRQGMRVDVTFSPRMTRSIPPQSNAFLIVTKPASQPAANVTTGRIVSVNPNNNTFVTGMPNNMNRQTRFVVTNSTLIQNRNGFPISLQRLRPGQLVRITHANFATASIPPQTTAFRIQVL